MEELGSIEPQVTATDMQRVESIARAAVGSQLPPGMSIEDAAQDVWVLALTKGSNSLEGSPSFIGNVAKGSVRREAARALSGNNAYLRAIKISLSGQEIVTSSNVLGSCAQRRAYYKAKGLPSPGLDEGKDIYGIVRFSDGTEMMDPAAVAEYKIILSDLIGPVFCMISEERRTLHEDIIRKYLNDYTIKAIADELDIPLGTVKSIWNSFKRRAAAKLRASGIEY